MATTENPVDLGDLERDVMQLIWANGPMTSDTVRERLPRKLKESTVRTVLRRLEHKGFVKHAVDGRTYVFEALEPRRDVAARAVRRIIDWLCDGSLEEVLIGMADKNMLDSARLRVLADEIAGAKRRRT
jgi:BlaI family penicillinase repressor